MTKYSLADLWMELPQRLVKWGILGYLSGLLIQLILFLPVMFIVFFIYEPYVTVKKNYKKAREEYLTKRGEWEP